MSGWAKNKGKQWGRIAVLALAIALSLPLEWGVLQGAYLWLSPFLAENRVLAGHGLLLFHLLSVLVLWACWRKRRWFCHTLCPVGWTCAWIARKSKRKRSASSSARIGESWVLLAIGFSLAGVSLGLLFDPLVLMRTFFSACFLPLSVVTLVWGGLFLLLLLSNYFFPLSWCKHLCPLGGLQVLVHEGSKRPSVWLSRRNSLLLMGGWASGFLLTRGIKAETITVFRPPSARKDADFYTACLRCGNCVDACPASIIRLTPSASSFWAWQTPQLDFSEGYCWSDCVKCGQVCPSGALASFTLAEKKSLVIGRAEVNATACLLTRNKECNRCRSVCTYKAIQLTHQDLLMEVRIDAEKCVGCNACAVICPADAIRVKPLSR